MDLPLAALIFTVYSFFGWVLEFVWRSFVDRRWERGGFSALPLCPVYGIGALIAVTMDRVLNAYPLVVEALVIGLMFTGLEYVTGVYSLLVFDKRLWIYKKGSLLNVQGHTDLFHFVMWCALGILLVKWIQPWLLAFLT